MTESISSRRSLLRPSKARALALCLLSGTVLSGCGKNEREASAPYDVASLERFRSQKNDYLRVADDSPIPVPERPAFPGLLYFPPDSTFAVAAEFEPFADPEPVTMMMTSGDPVTMERAGKFSFRIDGRSAELTAYRNLDHPERYFLPFRDATNGEGTYWAGRYLDIARNEGKTYLLDFNYAYNPYCAYNHAYACPVVPMENILTAAIPAGERFSDKHDDKRN